MTKETQPISTQEFTDKISLHRESLEEKIYNSLPPKIIELIKRTRNKTRQTLGINPENFVVILGEQTYGLNECPKVIGKRIFAKGLEKHGIQPIELFAVYDIASSEGAIYRMQIPHPNSPDGFISLNILKGWEQKKNVATVGFRPPTLEELSKALSTITSLYGKPKSDNLKEYLGKFYLTQSNYANANIEILREFLRQIGLQIATWASDGVLDTLIAKNGGMEVMLYLWPKLIEEAKKHFVDGVRIPEIQEAPFFLYHLEGCYGRMLTKFTNFDSNKELQIDSQVFSKCLHCGFSETTTPQEIIESGRIITWRAIPRVIAYSTLGIADGHITGGGSRYNKVAKPTIERLGLPYFPITNMNLDGGIFVYESSACKKGGKYKEKSDQLVKEGKVAMADLILSIGVRQLREVVEETLNNGVTTNTKLVFERTLPKNSQIIEF